MLFLKARLGSLIMVICIVISSAYVFMVLRKNISLGEKLEQQSRQKLEVGDIVPPLDIKDGQGSVSPLLLPDRPRVVVFVSSTCQFCAEYIKGWWPVVRDESAFVAYAPALVFVDARFKDVIKDPLDSVFCNDQESFIRACRVYSVPMTVLLSQDGEVLDLVGGNLTGDQFEKFKRTVLNIAINSHSIENSSANASPSVGRIGL